MTDRRKLQAEIDRVLKKVQEGTDDFEECLEKFNQNSNNPTQKEKYENDLKKEIKKLQRLRDQLKTWIQSSEVKDKTTLIECRKAIESLMERFKVVERETKTKAYSKEGLQAAEKRDLELEERDELAEWIREQLVKFNRQIDVCESELESLQASNRKKKNNKDVDRIGRLTGLIERHRYHVLRLETILRAVDNSAIAPDQLNKAPIYVDEDQLADILANQGNDDADEDNEERTITFCILIEDYLNRCSEEGYREVTDLYEQLAIDEAVDFTLPVNAQPSVGTTASSSTSQPPVVALSVVSNVPLVSVPQPPVLASTVDDKEIERDSRERDKTEQSLQTNGSRNAELSQEDSRKRQKSEERSARSKANQHSASSEKSPNAPPSSKNTAAATQLDTAAGATRVPTPPSAVPPLTPQPHTPRSAAPRTISATYSKSTYPDVVADPAPHVPQPQPQPPPPPPPPQPQPQPPLSYSTVVSSTGISYAAVAATASATQPPPPSNVPQAPPASAHPPASASPAPASSTAAPTSPGPQQISQPSLPPQAPPASYLQSFTTGSPQSQLHTPASLAAQAQAAALQSSLNADSIALALAARAGQANADALGNSTQNAAPSPPGTNAQTDLTASGATSFGSVNGAPNQLSASQSQPAVQPKITVTMNAVLGITPFGFKELNPAACEQHDLVERARKHMPLPSDSERARICLPRMPVPTPTYYPQLVPASIDTVEFFARQQPETLFFVFYYMEGTKAQLLAARALKQQQWRYHSKYLMWFQRLTEPTHITDEQETGTYIYFDYERWQTKRKEQFTFEYRYLEDKA